MKGFEERLPAGYHLAVGGPVEESAKSQKPIIAVVPLMLMTMATILMLQLRSFNRLFLVASVAPLAAIGVALALILTQLPLGFVAILGVVALIGILDPQLGDPHRPDREAARRWRRRLERRGRVPLNSACGRSC